MDFRLQNVRLKLDLVPCGYTATSAVPAPRIITISDSRLKIVTFTKIRTMSRGNDGLLTGFTDQLAVFGTYNAVV